MRTFRKARNGVWKVEADHTDESFHTRAMVEVTLKNGTTKTVKITSMPVPSPTAGKLWADFVDPDKEQRPARDVPRCDNCQRPLRGKGVEAVDSSGVRGLVCNRCSYDDPLALSFG